MNDAAGLYVSLPMRNIFLHQPKTRPSDCGISIRQGARRRTRVTSIGLTVLRRHLPIAKAASISSAVVRTGKSLFGICKAGKLSKN